MSRSSASESSGNGRCRHTASGPTTVSGARSLGASGNQAVPGYLEEKNVPPDSGTETFVALRTYVDTWRWSKVPFYLRTGKRLKERRSMVAVRFREPPMQLFQGTGASAVKARVLLMLALTRTTDPTELQRIFTEY